MRFMEPTIATVVTNPTNRDLKYTWLAKNGMFVKAKSSVTVPYCAYTNASPSQRSQMGEAMRSKMVKLEYLVRGVPAIPVKTLSTSVQYKRPKVEAPKPAPAPAAPAPPPPPAPAPHPPKKEKAKKEKAKKEDKPRTEIITAVGEGKDAVKDSTDIVQKTTGQKTVSMQEAMGWDVPPTEDPRMPQTVEAVKMDDALTEGVGDPLEKAAAAAAKEQKAKAAAKPKTKAKASTAKKAVDPKRSAAAKKAAATRKANAAKKK